MDIKSIKLNYYTEHNFYDLKSEVEQFIQENFKNKFDSLSVSQFDKSSYLGIAKCIDDIIKIEVQVHN